MDRSQSLAEFDIVRITPHVDLVLFDHVISCYPCDKDITANYILGQDVAPSSWDWIGIFRVDWRYLGEYLAYRWAQGQSTDCTSPRRRSLVFPTLLHQIPPSSIDIYQFIYVSHGNHVVGVSSPFKVTESEHLEYLNLNELFKEPSMTSIQDINRTRKACCPASDNYEIVNELPCPSLPKRRAKTKQKVTTVYRDTNTLVHINQLDWINKLRFVHVYPIVEEYRMSASATKQHTTLSAVKLYDVNRSGLAIPGTSGDNTWFQASIEYPSLKQLKAGPISFLMSLKDSMNTCTSCQIAKTLVEDLMHRETAQDEQIREMKLQTTVYNNTRSQTEDNQTTSAALLDWALCQAHDDNGILQRRVYQLEELLAEARAHRFQKPFTGNALIQASEEECGLWIIKDPRRIGRMKKIVGRQSRSIQTYRQMNESKQRVISKLRNENQRLSNLVQDAFQTSEKFREIAEELHARIKEVLAERAKYHTNEWRHFVRTVQENTTQTTCDAPQVPRKPNNLDTVSNSISPISPNSPSSSIHSDSDCYCHSSHQKAENKQIAKLLKSEKPTRPKLHKKRSEAEQCPTCGLKFSKKADRHVIEEHIVFHERNK